MEEIYRRSQRKRRSRNQILCVLCFLLLGSVPAEAERMEDGGLVEKRES
jgi:hypothetical protein